jgi:hypothetical protein
VVLPQRAPLEQQLALGVEEEDGEGPVQPPGRHMGGELLRGADRRPVLIDQFEHDRGR